MNSSKQHDRFGDHISLDRTRFNTKATSHAASQYQPCHIITRTILIDFLTLFIEASRHLVLANRFVSGSYLQIWCMTLGARV